MFKNTLIIISFFLLLFYSNKSEGQSYFSTKGTDFWFGFMQNYFGDSTLVDSLYPSTIGTTKMAVYITTDNQKASGTVSVPLSGWSKNFTVQPNSTTQIVIPVNTVMCFDSEVIEKKGIHLTTDIPVSVYQLNYVPFTSDANIIIPTQSLGTSYRAMCYYAKDGIIATSQLLIVAAYDGTVIKITPKCATFGPGGVMGHPADVAYTIKLNSGEVYQLQGNYTAPRDLTGTLVELDTTASDNCKKFAVFSGNESVFIPLQTCCSNHICEEMMPIKTWGTKYITIPLKTRASDLFRVIASKNGTIITWDGGPPIGLNAGDFYEYSSGTATYIEATEPVSVAQFSKSSKADGNVNADPFMIMLQPLDQSIGKIVFNSFTSKVITHYYLNLVTRTKYTGILTLDGNTIPAASFITVPHNPAYSYARIDLSQGNHSLKSDSGYTANIYGYGPYESYGYIAGATFIDPEIGFNVITPTATYKYYNFYDTLCRTTNLKFAAFFNPLITDYFWKYGDGSPVEHGQTVSHTYDKAGNYTLTYYYQRNSICGLDSLTWNIYIICCNPHPKIDATSPVCVGLNSSIADTSKFNDKATYTWNFNGGNILSGNGQGPYQVNWAASGNYNVKLVVTEPTCKNDSASTVITVNPIPTSSFTLNSPLCTGENTALIFTGNASAASKFNWDLSGAKIISGSGRGPYIVNWANAGTFNVTLIVSDGGCTSPPTVFPVTINPSPIPKFTPNPQTASTDNPVIIFNDNSLNTSIWSWRFGEPYAGTENYSSLQSPSHTYSGEGEFTVWLVARNSFGCIDSTSYTVFIKGFNTLFMPNAFTPNPDGLNDVFQPYGINIIDYELYIFDRWGGQIFISQTKNQPWDGRVNGKETGRGVYVWLIYYTDSYGFKHKAMGRVTLLR